MHIAGVVLVFSLLLCSCSSSVGDSTAQENDIVESAHDNDTEIIESEDINLEMNMIENFVEEFNSSCETNLVFTEEFTPSDRSSSHYRSEFRLNAYSEAIGMSYSFGDAIVDIVYRETFSNDQIIRVYMDNATFEQCEEMIRIASPIIDKAVTDEDIEETIAYINENVINGRREANGYYYSELGLVLFEEEDSCTMMLKMRND